VDAPNTRYATSGDAAIAYQVVGEGHSAWCGRRRLFPTSRSCGKSPWAASITAREAMPTRCPSTSGSERLSLELSLEYAVDELHCGGAFADRRGDPLD
jgi:hypothetical protein